MTWTEKPKTYKSFFFFSFLGRNIYAGVNQKQDSTRHKMLVRDLHLWHMQLLHYIAGATCVTNLMVNSSSPDSTPRSLNQTFCTTSPFTQLILLSRTRQFSPSGMTFLNVVSPEDTLKMSLNLAAETIGWRFRNAFPILSSAFKRSLSNTSYT